MKNSFFEKSTWKWIFAWLAVCWVFFLGAFAAEFTLSGLRIDPPNRVLEQAKWNGLIEAMGWFTSSVNANLKDSTIPKWTVIIYAWSEGNPCPKGWTQWTWWWKDRYIIPLQTDEWTSMKLWGNESFKIEQKNLPKHSHKILYGGYDTQWLSASTTLAVKNVQDGTTNKWDSDYNLAWSNQTANAWKTSEWWSEGAVEAIKLDPLFAKVLFCVKE